MHLLDKLYYLCDYMYYFQFTLNSYGNDVETNIPNKQRYIIPAFQKLSDMIGPDRVIWRYDPIFLNEHYTLEYHAKYFEKLAKVLCKYTHKCTISFIDMYRNTEKKLSGLSLQTMTPEKQEQIGKILSQIAHSYDLNIDTCAEEINLQQYRIQHARCIDDRLLGQLLGCPLKVGKDKNQRLECGCIESLDIGAYNTCLNGCCYCYANYSEKTVHANLSKHNPESPLIFGEIGAEDRITEKKMVSCKVNQLKFDM